MIAVFVPKTANDGTDWKSGQIDRPKCILYNISQNAFPELSHYKRNRVTALQHLYTSSR